MPSPPAEQVWELQLSCLAQWYFLERMLVSAFYQFLQGDGMHHCFPQAVQAELPFPPTGQISPALCKQSCGIIYPFIPRQIGDIPLFVRPTALSRRGAINLPTSCTRYVFSSRQMVQYAHLSGLNFLSVVAGIRTSSLGCRWQTEVVSRNFNGPRTTKALSELILQFFMLRIFF